MAVVDETTIRERLRVFLSYTREDRDAVLMVEQGLEHLRCQTWIDRKLTGGQAWWNEILREIRNCSAMVVAVSPAMLESQAVRAERSYARLLGKPLIPVLVAPVRPDVLPHDLTILQVVDYTTASPDAAFQLAGALSDLPPTPPLPDTLPPEPPVPVSYIQTLADQARAEDLTLDQQLFLVSQLRDAVAHGAHRDSAIELLRGLQGRRDLYHRAWLELESALRQVGDGNGGRPDPSAGEQPPSPKPSSSIPPGWYPDPSRRHQLRWFDGDWTEFAADGRIQVRDPHF